MACHNPASEAEDPLACMPLANRRTPWEDVPPDERLTAALVRRPAVPVTAFGTLPSIRGAIAGSPADERLLPRRIAGSASGVIGAPFDATAALVGTESSAGWRDDMSQTSPTGVCQSLDAAAAPAMRATATVVIAIQRVR
jgi:hypothetical protein